MLRRKKKTGLVLSRLERIADSLERSGIEDLLVYRTDTRKYIWSSFLGGLFRGLGISVGFTLLGAIVILILSELTTANLPVIGEFIAKLLKIIDTKM